MGTVPNKNENGNGNGARAVNGNGYNYNGNGYRTTQALSVALAGLSFMVSLGFGFYTVANPQGAVSSLKSEVREDMHREVARLDMDLNVVRQRMGERLSKEEHLEFKNGITEKTGNLREEINRIRADQVTRSEHQQHWAETSARIDGVRDLNAQTRREMNESVTALQKEIGGQYTIGDQMKNIQDQMKILGARLDALKNNHSNP